MKYHTKDQINKIAEKQEKATRLHEEMIKELAEAEELAKELCEYSGRKFIFDNKPYVLCQNSGVCGNHHWLSVNGSIKIIE